MFQNRMLFLMVAVMASTCALLPSAGCNSKPKYDLAKTTGTVTLDGKPVTTGVVAFIPDSGKGNSGPTGSGLIDENGRFEITTKGEPGALVGWNLIRVQVIDETKPDKPWLIPIKYNNPMKSGLSRQVKAGESNDFALKLTSD